MTEKTRARQRSAGTTWKLQDAKAHFSEVVRRARSEGPQRVTVRGRDAVVVVSAEEHERLSPSRPREPFVAFMEALPLHELDIERERDAGRETSF